MLKILADQAIPNAKQIFSAFGDVTLKYGRDIVADDLKGVDALIVRSVTKVDDDLLRHADSLKFVGTATSGIDHIDRKALESRQIEFAAAHGCNARSVADYILSVLMVLAQRYNLDFSKMSLGIVGLGHVGTRVYRRAQALGMKIVCSDPLRASQFRSILESMQGKGDPRYGGVDEKVASLRILSEGDDFLCDIDLADPELYDHPLEEALACDIVTLHVPLTHKSIENPFPTYHMIGAEQLATLHEGQILINTARGGVIDNKALYDLLSQKPGFIHAWLDVFENEPDILVPELIPLLEGCTAHIAGYAFEAKNRGTEMVAQAMIERLGLHTDFEIPSAPADIASIELNKNAPVTNSLLSRLVFSVYDVRRDDSLFRTQCYNGETFDFLRKHYEERHELKKVVIKCASPEQVRKLYHLGFQIRTATGA